MPRLGTGEWLIIILLVVLLFGAKRLPDAARSMGRSLRIFKAETRGLIDDNDQAAPPVQSGATAERIDPTTTAAPAPELRPAPGTEVPPKA